MNIGVIGAGMSGMALAQRLGVAGHKVTVFERADQPGGLATYQDHGEFVFDRFYHVILPTDRHLISFIGEIGLGDEFRWSKTLTGFFVDDRLHSVSNAIEFLKFPPLSLWAKIRLAFTILYCSRVNNWRRLENVLVEDWLIKLSGRSTYEKLWRPLLLAKLGENYRRVSAVFIWTYIKRMFSARDKSASREQMGYVRGGYKTVFDRIRDLIDAAGGSVELGVQVEHIHVNSGGRLEVVTASGARDFDKVVFTGPVNVLREIAPPSLVSLDHAGESVEYLGVLCMALITRKPLTPYYVLNIADSRIPFTGVIGMSTIVGEEDTAGLYLTYLPKYVLSTDDDLRRSDEEVVPEFMSGLRVLFPDLDPSDIVSNQIYRAYKVQPLQVLEFSKLIPKNETLHPDFFVLNTAQFVKNTLNNNEVVRAVDEFLEHHGDNLAPAG